MNVIGKKYNKKYTYLNGNEISKALHLSLCGGRENNPTFYIAAKIPFSNNIYKNNAIIGRKSSKNVLEEEIKK